MRLCGITSLDQATPDLVNTLDVDYMVVPKKGESKPRRSRKGRQVVAKL
jgi:L-lactate dehydrogenase (cytochrome)